MSVVLRVAAATDAEKWDNIVEKDPQGTFFDRFEWVTALGVISQKVKPLPLLIEVNGEAGGVFPSCLIAASLRKTLESLPFSDYGGGPLFRKAEIQNSALFSEFVDKLVQFCSRRGVLKVSVRRAFFPSMLQKIAASKQVVVDTDTCTFVVPLDGRSSDSVFKGLKKVRRNFIKQGRHRGLIVRQAENIHDLEEYYRIYVDTMKRLKCAPLPYVFFEHIWKIFKPRKEMGILLADCGDVPVAGVMQFNYKKTCYWTGNVSLEQYWSKRPSDLLTWSLIEWAVENGFEEFDMGSTINDAVDGHYSYKESWGGRKVTLYNYHVILKPKLYSLYKLSAKLLSIN